MSDTLTLIGAIVVLAVLGWLWWEAYKTYWR